MTGNTRHYMILTPAVDICSDFWPAVADEFKQIPMPIAQLASGVHIAEELKQVFIAFQLFISNAHNRQLHLDFFSS